MPTESIRLLYRPASITPKLMEELTRLGFSLVSMGDSSKIKADGLLVLTATDLAVQNDVQRANVSSSLLVLVYGDLVPYGFADQIASNNKASGLEVVRLFVLGNGDRALVGGEIEGTWVTRLRRQLACYGVISLLCRRSESEEAARQLPLYLRWKEEFYLRMGESCDRVGARLPVVAQALGMDKRIGQGWLTRSDSETVLLWLTREITSVLQKTNVESVALWGSLSLWAELPIEWSRVKEARVYGSSGAGKPNVPIFGWKQYDCREETLHQADLLVIAEADRSIQECDLAQIVDRMRQPIVIDSCACFPLQEAEGFSIMYRTIGQNTNVWEWNGL